MPRRLRAAFGLLALLALASRIGGAQMPERFLFGQSTPARKPEVVVMLGMRDYNLHGGPFGGADIRFPFGPPGRELDLSGQVGHPGLPIDQESASLFPLGARLASGSLIEVGVNGQHVESPDIVLRTFAPDLRLDRGISVFDLMLSVGHYEDRNGVVPNATYRGIEVDGRSATFLGHPFGASLIARAGDLALPANRSGGTHILGLIEPGAKFEIGGLTGAVTGHQVVYVAPSFQLFVQRVSLKDTTGTVTSSNRVSNAITVTINVMVGSVRKSEQK